MLKELRDVQWRDRFTRRLAQRGFMGARLFADYMSLAAIVAPALITATITCDPADDVALATAIGASADLIVSGDAHLLNLKSFQGIAIVTAAAGDRRINAGG